jgi:hypothetical protein
VFRVFYKLFFRLSHHELFHPRCYKGIVRGTWGVNIPKNDLCPAPCLRILEIGSFFRANVVNRVAKVFCGSLAVATCQSFLAILNHSVNKADIDLLGDLGLGRGFKRDLCHKRPHPRRNPIMGMTASTGLLRQLPPHRIVVAVNDLRIVYRALELRVQSGGCPNVGNHVLKIRLAKARILIACVVKLWGCLKRLLAICDHGGNEILLL